MRDQEQETTQCDNASDNPYSCSHVSSNLNKQSDIKSAYNYPPEFLRLIDSLLEEVYSLPTPVVDHHKPERQDSLAEKIAKKYGVNCGYLIARAKLNPERTLEEVARVIRKRGPGANRFGRESDDAVATLLSEVYGRSVSRSQEYHWPFDLLVDGWKIDVKAAHARKTEYGTLSWTFNIKQNGIINERSDAYIFRMEDVPGTCGPVHLFVAAPLRRSNFVVSKRFLLLNKHKAMEADFYRFSRGEMGARLEAVSARA